MVNGERTSPLGLVEIEVSTESKRAIRIALVFKMDGLPLLLGNYFLRHLKKFCCEATTQLFLGEFAQKSTTKQRGQPVAAREYEELIPQRTMATVEVEPPGKAAEGVN